MHLYRNIDVLIFDLLNKSENTLKVFQIILYFALFSVQTHIVDVCERAFLLAHLENKINKKKKKSNIAKSLRGQPRSSTTARASCASSSATAERKGL
jgi:hypothetical protein